MNLLSIYIPLATVSIVACATGNDDEFLGPNGRIMARVKIVDDRKQFRTVSEVEEIFSSQSERSRIRVTEFKYGKRNNLVDYISDSKVMITPALGGCRITNPSNMLESIFGEAVFTEQEWMNPDNTAPDYLFGLSRLLYILHNAKDAQPYPRSTNLVHNQRAIRYEYRIDTQGQQRKRTNIIFYRLAPVDGFDLDKLGLPALVWLFMTGGRIYMIDYLLTHSLKPFGWELNSPSISFMSTISLPAGLGCSSVINQQLESLGKVYVKFELPRQVSFKATMTDYSSKMPTNSEYFIAYDGHLSMVRIEKATRMNDARDLEDKIYLSTTIHDIRRSIRYHIGSASRSATYDNLSRSNCVSVRAADDKTNAKYEPIINLHELVEIGLDRIRNVRVRIFERETIELPALFFPQLDYVDQSNKLKSLSSTLADRLWLSGKSITSLVYYFADEDSSKRVNDWKSDKSHRDTFNKLVRVQVMVSGFVIAEVEVFDFVWSIQQAPSGVSPDDMFALEEQCCTSGDVCGPTRRAHLDMLLEYCHSDAYGHQLDAGKLNELLDKSSVFGNQDFLRALVNSAPVSATQIHYIDTRILKSDSDEKLLFEVNAHLSQPRVPLVNVQLIGSAESYSVTAMVIEAITIHDCYWQAIDKLFGRPAVVLFGFCGETCVIDQDASLNSDTGKWSSHFVVSDEKAGLCDIYKVDSVKSESSVRLLRKSWLETYTSLVGRMLTMDLVGRSSPDDGGRSLLLKTVRAEIRSDRWLASEGSAESSDVATDGIDQNIAESARTTLTGVGLLAKQDGGAGEPVSAPTSGAMNLARCHAACLARLTCNSFSLCDTRTGRQCMTSELSFEQDPAFLKAIEKTMMVKKSSDSIRPEISIRYNPTTSGDDDESESVESQERDITFRVHAKCQISERKPTEMFAYDKSVSLPIRRSTKPKRVKSQQACAALCLARNMAFIRRYSKSGASRPGNLTQAWCVGFTFLDFALVSVAPEVFELIPLEKGQGGICMLQAPELLVGLNGASEDRFVSERYPFDSFKFLYSNLYERYPDVRVLAGSRSSQSMTSFDSVETCARSCFMHLVDLESTCKSFDVVNEFDINRDVTDQNGNMKRIIRKSYCVFNTVTLTDLQYDPSLVENSTSQDNVNVVHYEPYEALNFDDKAFLVGQSGSVERLKSTQTNMEGVQTNLGSYFVILLLAITSGIVVGILLFRSFEQRINQDVANQIQVSHKRFEHDLDILEH